MKVLMLAAGMGRRFNKDKDEMPKCLAVVGGETVIDHNISAIRTVGPEIPILVVTGFMSAAVEQHLRRARPGDDGIVTVYNQDFRDTVLKSVRTGLAAIGRTDAVLLINGDTRFGTLLFRAAADLSRRPADGIVLFGHLTDARRPDDMLILVENGTVMDVGKEIMTANGVSSGAILLCGGGLTRYVAVLGRPEVAHLTTHHAVLRHLVRAGERVAFRDLGAERWIEIDSKADLQQGV